MPKQKYFFLILGAILIILNCNKKSTDPEIKPPMVIFVPSSDPLNEEERGIDAIPEGDGIFIARMMKRKIIYCWIGSMFLILPISMKYQR